MDLPRDFTADDVHRCYREAAKRHHPDVGGDPQNMVALNRAKEAALAYARHHGRGLKQAVGATDDGSAHHVIAMACSRRASPAHRPDKQAKSPTSMSIEGTVPRSRCSYCVAACRSIYSSAGSFQSIVNRSARDGPFGLVVCASNCACSSSLTLRAAIKCSIDKLSGAVSSTSLCSGFPQPRSSKIWMAPKARPSSSARMIWISRSTASFVCSRHNSGRSCSERNRPFGFPLHPASQ
jgi:hypothetical protein